jgi:hypothetical protein
MFRILLFQLWDETAVEAVKQTTCQQPEGRGHRVRGFVWFRDNRVRAAIAKDLFLCTLPPCSHINKYLLPFLTGDGLKIVFSTPSQPPLVV